MFGTDGTGNYFYPSVSSSWIFSDSFDMPAWMTFGKVRLSWAQVDNDTNSYNINKGYSIDNYELSDGNVYMKCKLSKNRDSQLEPVTRKL